MSDLSTAISKYGASAYAKLANIGVKGDPESQLHAPLTGLVEDLAAICTNMKVAVVPEVRRDDLRARPDFAITVNGALVGFIEAKAPGKGADPRLYSGHDKAQWDKLRNLPNLIYTDGNSFSLWRDGEQFDETRTLLGDVRTSGPALDAPSPLLSLFDAFFAWEPQPPSSAAELAETTARRCRLLRGEVEDELAAGDSRLIGLAEDWREYLFPGATDAEFADGYAQAVTFGLLIARARGISLAEGPVQAALHLQGTNTLIGKALSILTHNLGRKKLFETSVMTLSRVLDVVDWAKVSRGQATAWLHFYEDFLQVYDAELRKRTGSYYTPPEVVRPMVRWVDALLETRFGQPQGIASDDVTVADPALGTGTFALGVLRRIAERVATGSGEGAVAAVLQEAVNNRIIAFEKQLGPYAVAELRLLAEVEALADGARIKHPRIWVADTLANPHVKIERLPWNYEPLGKSLRAANKIKRDEPITIVIGNPPYRERAKGEGGWIETAENAADPQLRDWMPPPRWGVSAHAKHLYNLYVYFWRWAAWKVFEQQEQRGVVCFITVAGFLNGPGFERMREYLRLMADELWVVDCSPEGHQPEVSTRIFQGVQQPVCIVVASRSHADGAQKSDATLYGKEGAQRPTKGTPAKVWFRALPEGHRRDKFAALAQIDLDGEGWVECPTGWRKPFLPGASGAWADCVPLGDLFAYDGSGVMPGRTWVIAPDVDSLRERWRILQSSRTESEWELRFRPHWRKGKPGDSHYAKESRSSLHGQVHRSVSVMDDSADCIPPVRYGYRSFDRQWIIPDKRLINQPNPTLWRWHSSHQVCLTALMAHAPTSGPSVTFTGLIPDLHHYKGSFGGRVFPLWADAKATKPNIKPALTAALTSYYDQPVSAADVMTYIAAVAAHPGYPARFADDLTQPGLRIPFTADAGLFTEAVELGRRVVWLHTFGERFTDAADGRPHSAPRLPDEERPRIPKGGAIPTGVLPDVLDYDPATKRLTVGGGHVEPVERAVWDYEVSGKNVLRQWFSYRGADRDRPLIGSRRPPSPLNQIRPDGWPASYTTELLDLINVLGLIVKLEPQQGDVLERIMGGELLTVDELAEQGAFAKTKAPAPVKKAAVDDAQMKLV